MMHILNFGIGQKLGQDVSFRESFDVAVARAVAEMRILGKRIHICFFLCVLCSLIILEMVICFCHFAAEYCLPLVRTGGIFVAAKGHDPQVCFSYDL